MLTAQQQFTATRSAQTADEIWGLEHLPVFTLGQAGKRQHLLQPGDIPVVQSDRGGDITYHGPGQLIIYLLLDCRRRRFRVRRLVNAIEDSLIHLLASWKITARARADAPGVYVEDAKIASLGLRIGHKGSYHGLALNLHMDLSPFTRINPCGMAGLHMIQASDLGIHMDVQRAYVQLAQILADCLGYQLLPCAAHLPNAQTKAAPNQAAQGT